MQHYISIKNKTKNHIIRCAEDLNRLFSKENIQVAKKHVEKKLNITYYQRNANQNYNKVSPHTGQNGYDKKVYKQ